MHHAADNATTENSVGGWRFGVAVASFVARTNLRYTVSQKRICHPTADNNFNSNCPIPIIFRTNISE